MPRKSLALSDWGESDDVVSQKSWFRKGDILFGKLRPYFHKVGVAAVDGVCSTDIVVLAPRTPEWFGYVVNTVSSDEFVAFVTASSDGTKMPRTRWDDMARYPVVIPPEPLAALFTAQAQRLLDMIICNIWQSRLLATTRDALLPKLLSGEIRVREAERQVEAVL
jgi:type I restriction enzyme S subunit